MGEINFFLMLLLLGVHCNVSRPHSHRNKKKLKLHISNYISFHFFSRLGCYTSDFRDCKRIANTKVLTYTIKMDELKKYFQELI